VADDYATRAKEYLDRIIKAQRDHGHRVKLSKEQLGRAVERTSNVFRRLDMATEAAKKQKFRTP
jgi:hypothetical protein